MIVGCSALLLAAGLPSCGARSDLQVGASCHEDDQCDDGVPCTVDTCTPRGCIHTPDDAACSDGVTCSVDVCDRFTGCHSTPEDSLCDDGVKCTTDSCDAAQDCQHVPVASVCDDGVDCTVDSCDPVNDCHHEPDDQLCDDGIFCTLDTCDPHKGCHSGFSNAVCDDGIECTTDSCDPTLDACVNDACDSVCDDGVFCNGVERCDTTHGCTAGAPACELGVDCSQDTCSEGDQQCQHQAPGSCFPSVKLLVADKGGALLAVSPFGGPAQSVTGPGSGVHYDIAILGNRWFVINPGKLLELLPKSNTVKTTFSVPDANSLGAGPDGQLYAASSTVYRIDPDSGAVTTLGELPTGYQSSGDIAFLGNRMFLSTDGPCGGALLEVDPQTGASKVLGGTGLSCVYGLAVWQGTMFLLNCDGKIGTFDPDTGEAHVLSTPAMTVYGADVLPP